MSIWNSISELAQGVGSSVGGLLGGFSRNSSAPEKSVAFTIGMIALGAKMAKADGIVTDDEVDAFREVFRVPENDMAAVTRVFNLAKQDVAGFESYASQVAKLFPKKPQVLENVLDGLFHIAKADGLIHENEIAYLEQVAKIFGFDKQGFARIRAHHVLIQDDPYEILGVDRGETPASIKKKYKTLVKNLHPDKQMAEGVPAEMVKLANERLARINAAYGEIEKELVS
ncbi:MAG: molecular chaperone DjiA [Aestuariivirga sp.]